MRGFWQCLRKWQCEQSHSINGERQIKPSYVELVLRNLHICVNDREFISRSGSPAHPSISATDKLGNITSFTWDSTSFVLTSSLYPMQVDYSTLISLSSHYSCVYEFLLHLHFLALVSKVKSMVLHKASSLQSFWSSSQLMRRYCNSMFVLAVIFKCAVLIYVDVVRCTLLKPICSLRGALHSQHNIGNKFICMLSAV